MGNIVHLWLGKNGTPRREGLIGDLHHRGEALGGQLAQAGEQPSAGQIEVDPDGE